MTAQIKKTKKRTSHYVLYALLCLMMCFVAASCSLQNVPRKLETCEHPVEVIPDTLAIKTDVPIELLDITETPTEEPTETSVESSDDTSFDKAAAALSLRVETIVSEMTLEEKIGQMFLCRNPLTDGAKMIAEYHPGGIIFFGRDFKNTTPEEFLTLTKEYQSASEVGLLTAVDEEGGTVNRVSLYKAFRETPFQSPSELYAEEGIDSVLSDCDEKDKLLLSLGINFNIAPVADISTDENDFIYKRSLGKDARETSDYVTSVVKKMSGDGILCALKHFPGYGNNADTHTGVATDERSYKNFTENDFLPFAAGIAAGAPVVLVSHNIVKCIDETRPSSLSPEVNRVLREELGFDGVIMTDDLSMDAIKDSTDGASAAVAAVLAGNDLLCCSDVAVQYKAVLEAVRSGTITEKRIEASTKRIVIMKLTYGIAE